MSRDLARHVMKQVRDSQRPRVVFIGLPAIKTDEEGFPIVPSYRLIEDGDEVVNAVCWCLYYLKWHYHGALEGKPGSGNGHRVAQCLNRESPYLTSQKDGDILEEVGTITSADMKAYERDAEHQARMDNKCLAVLYHRDPKMGKMSRVLAYRQFEKLVERLHRIQSSGRCMANYDVSFIPIGANMPGLCRETPMPAIEFPALVEKADQEQACRAQRIEHDARISYFV
jgi:hypothetical protein